MYPSGFDESNGQLSPPEGVSEAKVKTLRVFRDGEQVISCWKPTQEEIDEIQRTGRVWLGVMGITMPPVYITGFSPFVRRET